MSYGEIIRDLSKSLIKKLSAYYLFIIVLVFGGLFLVCLIYTKTDVKLSTTRSVLILVGLPVAMAIIGILSIYLLDLLKRRDLSKTIEELEEKLAHPQIAIINKSDYGRILKKWNDIGPGNVLLYNIELQSFTEDEIQKTWGGLAKLENIKNVVLLLPRRKVLRWQCVVYRERSEFFAKDKGTRKFQVCEVIPQRKNDPLQPNDIAFALYRFGDDPSQGRLHDTAAVFVLSQPFCNYMEPLVPGADVHWWDYHHVLKFEKDQELINNLQQIWTNNFDKQRMRDMDRVIEDSKPLEAIEPNVLFERLRVDEDRKATLLSHLQLRKQISRNPDQIPVGAPEGEFTIVYDNGDIIRGHYRLAATHVSGQKPAIVWVGGFTETHRTTLPRLFKRVLKGESAVQFHYEVSPEIEYTTLSRYSQDMEEVLRYVNHQKHITTPGKTVLIARSINGLIAVLVASKEEFLDMLAGVVLVAPVFDVIEMINNYRASQGQEHVRVEKCWRCSPGYTADKWENKELGWLEFFQQYVSLAVMGDIIKNNKEYFSIDAFKECVGKISHHCPVYILSHPKDPITGSEKALEMLENAASGGGLINTENYKHLEINSSHLPVNRIGKDRYPYEIRDYIRSEQKAFRGIFQKLGIATLEESGVD